MKSEQISHVPCVDAGKNLKVFDHTVLYLLQKVIYLGRRLKFYIPHSKPFRRPHMTDTNLLNVIPSGETFG